jgi:DNA-binding SARP family transcriptional activator/Tfp pilus assembly protein PilF
MRFRILGPLEVWTDGNWQPISAEKWRSLLACLLLRAGQVVPTDTLADELWGDDQPAKAKNLISIYVLRLRRLLGDADGKLLAWRAPGYVLTLAGGDLDAARFDALVADGHRALEDGDAVRAAALLGAGLSLWRGPFLGDVPPTPFISTHAERLREHRLSATELWASALIESDRHGEAIRELRGLVTESPLREGLWLLLMRALEAAGRRAEALDVYAQAREVISEELGVDPGPDLQRLYAQLLAADAALPAGEAGPGSATSAAGAAGPSPAGAAGPRAAGTREQEPPGTISMGTYTDPGASPSTAVAAGESGMASRLTAPASGPASQVQADLVGPWPAQLPADIGDFTGREPHVRQLCDMLTSGAAHGSPGAVPVAFVAGAGGLGKTTLAVHAAHQIRDQFPDGQLYVDLLGAAPQPLNPGEVLARFLRDLGVEGDKVPAGDEERAALYRTRLTGRRVLVVLDNARDTAQVRPLLPGSASCAVLVTTRNRTADLASTRYVDLNVLGDDEALTLFTRILGDDDRPAAEPEATAEVLLACAGLPLAIRICAARLAARRRWNIATMASRLRDERRRLDELTTGDLAVRACFQVSYDSLSAPRHGADPARVFRLLGLWQGPSVSRHAAAALLGEPEPDVAEALESLVDANLLESSDSDWYRFHDLLRFYATERATETESEEDRAAAIRRLLAWYACTADAAADAISPHRYRPPGDSRPEGEAMPMPSVNAALAWYDSERDNLMAATRQAAAVGSDDVAWRLPVSLFPLFSRRRNMAECVTATRIALASARVAGHRPGEAWALQNLGQALAKSGDPESLPVLEQALSIRRDLDDRSGQAQTAISLADAYHKIQGADVAYEHSRDYLEILREVGNESLLGVGLVNHGEFATELGKLDEAVDCFREAYDLWKHIGGYGQGWALHNLGHVYLKLGRLDEAIVTLQAAFELNQASGDVIAQVTTLDYLSQAHRAAGDSSAARQARDAALALLEGLKQDADVIALQASIASTPDD